MFRNFIDPPSLDRNSLNESQKRSTNNVDSLDQSYNTNGGVGVGGVNSSQFNDSQVYYHHSSDLSSQPNGAHNGGYTTSIFVGSKSDSFQPPQYYSSPQQQQPQQQSYYQQSQLNQNQTQQHYNHASQRQQIPQFQQNGHDHHLPFQPPSNIPHLDGNISDIQGSVGTDIHLVQQRLAGTSLHDTTYVNGNGNTHSSLDFRVNNQPRPASGVVGPSPHYNFPNASYPFTPPAFSHGHSSHPAPTRGHALGSITENGLYENSTEDAFTNHQHQQQMHSQQHHQHQQQVYAQHQQFVPPTRPQQSWGSGWALPPAISNTAAQPAHCAPPFSSDAPPQKRFNVIPPPPPLSEPVFAGRRDVKQPSLVQESQIVSEKGTVRGFKNRVRAGIATFWAQPEDPVSLPFSSVYDFPSLYFSTNRSS
ncbi:hypothetical protein ElyMa_001942300 [Elysia marginata]|uniref:Uncharacterized protein n=1 Tax=Elysia marginata TaxID=1093978 RepID=A0AAV4EVP0_9GAST|nr:hypothetical protein ElyMa_001942300 [Elysia marginata]